MKNKSFVANVEEDPETGDFVLVFPDELVEQVGWLVGDTIKWTDNQDGTWTLTKNDTKDDTAV